MLQMQRKRCQSFFFVFVVSKCLFLKCVLSLNRSWDWAPSKELKGPCPRQARNLAENYAFCFCICFFFIICSLCFSFLFILALSAAVELGTVYMNVPRDACKSDDLWQAIHCVAIYRCSPVVVLEQQQTIQQQTIRTQHD